MQDIKKIQKKINAKATDLFQSGKKAELKKYAATLTNDQRAKARRHLRIINSMKIYHKNLGDKK